jgi:hypothetical protein
MRVDWLIIIIHHCFPRGPFHHQRGVYDMAQLSLGESKWRMLRRVIRKKRFTYPDARSMTRADEAHFEWMVDKGFFVAVGDDWYEVSDKGRAAADLGFYEM